MQKNNRVLFVFLVFFAASLVGLVGCAGLNGQMVEAAVLSPALAPVLDRHDAYVRADATLNEVEKSTFLTSSELTRSILDAATAP